MKWEWAAAGAVLLMAVIYCVRLMRRGLSTLEDEREICRERIEAMENQVREDQKNMPSSEHLHIAHAALRDLLRLAGNPPGFALRVCRQENGGGQPVEGGAFSQAEALVLSTPGEEWRVSLSMRERRLRGVSRVAHGQGCWHLHGPGVDEDFFDLADLMRALHACVGGLRACATPDAERDVPPEQPHLARRFFRPKSRKTG